MLYFSRLYKPILCSHPNVKFFEMCWVIEPEGFHFLNRSKVAICATTDDADHVLLAVVEVYILPSKIDALAFSHALRRWFFK